MTKRPLPLALALLLLPLALPARAQRSDDYETYCAVCHGEDGKAQTEKGRRKRARDFTNRKWQQAVDDARIERSIAKGHDRMPAFGKKISAEQIKALVKEVRSFAPRS